MKLLTILLAAITLSGCVNVTTKEHLPEVIQDFGPAPQFPEGIRSAGIAFFKYQLKDGESAIFKVSNSMPCWMRQAPIKGGKIIAYGHCAYININAKNSYGGYTGFKLHRVFIKNNQVITEFYSNPWYSDSWMQADWSVPYPVGYVPAP